jgi:glycosyltransferase involved in cell wall biosynthesis
MDKNLLDIRRLKNKLNISFIIPCYNSERTIDETVDSIFALNLQNFEICLVDDGSTDKTWQKLESFQKMYPDKVKIGQNPENRGGGYTRNICFSLSEHPNIFLLDSDNVLESNSFFRLIDATREEDNLITFDKIKFFYSTPFRALKLFYKDLNFLQPQMSFNDLRKTLTHPVVSGNYLFRRDVFEKINGYETDLGAMDTWSFGYKALLAGYKFKIVPSSHYLHRVHLDSYWFRELDKNFENLRTLLLRFPDRFSAQEIDEIKNAKDVTKFLINQKDDFFQEHINFPYSIPLKIHNFLFLRGK